MAQLSTIPVSVVDGDITIDAEALASKLGLSIEALKENMAKGLVTSVAEAGVDEEVGRVRLTFRYRARVWPLSRASLARRGRGRRHIGREHRPRRQRLAGEHRSSKSGRFRRARVMTATAWGLDTTSTVDDNTSDTLAGRLRAHLQAVARQRVPITYQEAAKALRLTPPNTIHQVAMALERLMTEDAAANRPFIAAMVISKARGGLPAPGFFDIARHLGRFAGDPAGSEAWAFRALEFNAAVGFWAASRSPGDKFSNDRRDARQAGASISEQET